MKLQSTYDPDGITLTIAEERRGLLSRLLSSRTSSDIDHLSLEDRSFAIALADTRALAEEHGERLDTDRGSIRLSHSLAARLDARSAEVWGLPPIVDLSYRTDVAGALGSSSFQLIGEWYRNGRRESPDRTGCILHTERGDRRLPHWLLETVDVIEGFEPGDDLPAQWQALARFRKSLDPGIRLVDDPAASKLSITDFLQGLEVRSADRFSMTPKEGRDGLDFDLVPFSADSLERSVADGRPPEESDGELDQTGLASFQKRVRTQGALPAYRTGDGQYLVIDAAAAPILDLMVEKQRAPVAERESFVRNPGPAIAERVETWLRASGRLDGLTGTGEAELIDAAGEAAFVETSEWSERVIGKTVYRKPEAAIEGSGTTWLPEIFAAAVADEIERMDRSELTTLRNNVQTELGEKEQAAYVLDSGVISVDRRTIQSLDARIEAMDRNEALDQGDPLIEKASEDEPAEPAGPIVIETRDNTEALEWQPQSAERTSPASVQPGVGVATTLKSHQADSLDWQIRAWHSGLPGVLNADEQGLGKTLQTLAFLRWLREVNAEKGTGGEHPGPILIVAPTTLLENWEAEGSRHLDEGGLGHLIRLFGSGIGTYKRSGAKGFDTKTGDDLLDLGLLRDAIENGSGHRFWVLTTYTTLANYQHSLARLPFATVVFDEIQALKNQSSLRAVAARAVNADFRIGLTGTPIENAASDLWAIIDQLCPGSLDSLRDFRMRYGEPSPDLMAELHRRVFTESTNRPALAIRRIKSEVARDLPAKSRRIHPREMPALQADTYELARQKLAGGTRGAALKMLHHIRTVSVHPAMDGSNAADADFIDASARLSATFDILRTIKAKGERALVFIENLKMQYRFVALARAAFKLDRIDLINGGTPISKRQAIVDRFQQHLIDDGGFDLLVLAPKAAGTGLTLTAATHVIHLSRWWNPAVEEQCNDRVHRIGQDKAVTVHVPMAIHPTYREHSFDCLLHSLMTRKRKLAASALWPMGDTAQDTGELETMVAQERCAGSGEPVEEAMAAMFARDRQDLPDRLPDRSLPFD